MTEHTHQPCPLGDCDSSDAFAWNNETGKYYCHSCGNGGGGMFSYGEITPMSNCKKEEEGMTLEPYIPEEGYRGISPKTLEKYGVYFTKVGDKETVHYTYSDTTTKHRELPKNIKVSGKLDCFYGQADYSGGKNITITEGEEDRLSVIEMMGDWPTVSVPGATPSKAFWENARQYLSSFEKIVLSVDNDSAGNTLAEKFYRMFPGKVYRVNHGKYKDANEFLKSKDKSAYKTAWWNAAPIKPDSILCTSEDFNKLYDETPDYEYFSTGIPELDKKMLGIHKGAFTLILAETGLGKSLAPGTPVLRYDGEVVRADEVEVGDRLMGPDSKPRNVTDVNLQTGPMYRITPVKGEPFECNADHILSLKHTSTNEVKNVVLTDYLKWTKTEKHKWKLWRTGIGSLNRGYNNPVMAYCVGAYLGDGREQGPEICMGKKKQAVIDYMLDTELNPTRMKFDRGAYYIGFSKKDRLWCEVERALKGGRHIPQYFKIANEYTRSNILAGLLDTDGSETGGGAEITQKSKQLSDDIVFVARSLGLAAYQKEKVVNGESYWRVGISGDMTSIPCKRLKFKPRKQVKDVLKTGFKVEPIGEGTYRGIALDGDHLFLLGDFTVTHNTELFRYLEWQCLSTSEYSFAACHGEETPLRSLLGLVSYDLQTNVTRKDLIDEGGYEPQVRDSISRITRDERFYQFKIRVDEGVDDIVDQVRFLATAFGVDYIFLEPIQDFVSAVNTSEKESLLTDLTNKLKRLAPELNVGIVVIAHANKEGEAKYCASIVQGAAYEIRLERDVDSEDEEERNTTRLYVGRKNRTGGGSGPAGALTFDRDTYMLTPVEDDSPVFNNTPNGSKDIGF